MQPRKRFTAVLLLPLGLSFVDGWCEGLFPIPCDVPFVAYNDVIDGFFYDEICVTGDGKIYALDGCQVMLMFEVPGSHSLNAIEEFFVAVGNSGTIARYEAFDWFLVNSPTTRNLRDICYSSSAGAHFAVGDSGTIIKSTDDGETWAHLTSPTSVNLNNIECGYNSVRIFGDDLTGYKSTDGGTSWSPVQFYGTQSPASSTQGNNLHTSFFLSESTGYVFGAFGIMFRTTNAGSTWRIGFADGFDRINTAYFTSRNSGVVAGDNGRISFTTNGGRSWFQDSLASRLTTQNINQIRVRPKDSVAVIVGDSGTVIYVTPDSTLVSVPDEGSALPQRYILSQNYPNPFNPTTTISFTVKHASFVTLRVFNLLGEEIATLVKADITPGRYTHTFDGSFLSSGVYLYRLEVQPNERGERQFVETKKMLLLR